MTDPDTPQHQGDLDPEERQRRLVELANVLDPPRPVLNRDERRRRARAARKAEGKARARANEIAAAEADRLRRARAIEDQGHQS